MAEEDEGNDNFIDIEEDEEDENQVSFEHNNYINFNKQGEGMQFDLSKAVEECKGIEKIEERKDTKKVSVLNNLLTVITLETKI